MSGETRWYKPKLIEVSIPLEDINRESAREKSIRHGHPSTLHLWWARRPLAACRAVLFAQLVDDPSAHPEQFPTEEAQKGERERLHAIIKRLVVWENIHDEVLLKEAREEIWKSCGGNPPPILDPFAGGGSIPLEAQRLGLKAHASDLNPVAVLINKALIEIPSNWAGQPPTFPGAADSAHSWPGATGLAEDVRRYGHWIRDEAEKRIGHLYPKAKLPDGTEATVIAWIWARTATCPNPACRAIMPLVSSYWLSKKRDRPTWLQPILKGKTVSFEVRVGQPGPEEPPKRGRGANFVCLVCGSAGSPNDIHHEIDEHLAPQPILLAIVAEGNRQRLYLPAAEEHVTAARECDDWAQRILEDDDTLTAPARGTFGGNAQGRRYGFKAFSDYFTPRQLIVLSTFCDLIKEAHLRATRDAMALGLSDVESARYGASVSTYLGFALSRIVDRNNTLCTWDSGPAGTRSSTGGSARTATVRNAFARQALPMTWDYAEASPFSSSGGSIDSVMTWLVPAIAGIAPLATGIARQADATAPDIMEKDVAVATDPPYYDNIGYADLSDFFYVWLRRSIGDLYPELFGTMLTPKASELIATPYRFDGDKRKADSHFEQGFVRAFRQIRDAQVDEVPVTFFYAFKQAERDEMMGTVSTGWETMLEGLLRAQLSVTATWPMRTELGNRIVGTGRNVLASSIVLACRPRPDDAPVTDRRALIAALREELPNAVRTLQQGGVAPVDLPQAAIGPGMAVFSRYARVNEPDGSAMRVRPALSLINHVLDEVLSQQEGDFGADTRWCLEWFKSYGFDQGPYGVAETLSKAKNTSVTGLQRAGVLTSRAGKVRLLSTPDLPADYDPGRDDRVSEWEIVLHLAKRLTEQGGDAAAWLMAAARSVVDLDAVRELAYLLFSIAEKRGWADIALLFNGLGTSWSDLSEGSRKPGIASTHIQSQLGFDTDEG
jgi:putative DNA methylase